MIRIRFDGRGLQPPSQPGAPDSRGVVPSRTITRPCPSVNPTAATAHPRAAGRSPDEAKWTAPPQAAVRCSASRRPSASKRSSASRARPPARRCSANTPLFRERAAPPPTRRRPAPRQRTTAPASGGSEVFAGPANTPHLPLAAQGSATAPQTRARHPPPAAHGSATAPRTDQPPSARGPRVCDRTTSTGAGARLVHR
jgi:hypothetical protein